MVNPIFDFSTTEGVREQLEEWVKGNPVHNPMRDECCPDFSCCHPALLWPEEKRKFFARATARERDVMLFGALRDTLEAQGCHVVGSSLADE